MQLLILVFPPILKKNKKNHKKVFLLKNYYLYTENKWKIMSVNIFKIFSKFIEIVKVLHTKPIHILLMNFQMFVTQIINFNLFNYEFCSYEAKYFDEIKKKVDVWKLCKTNLGGCCHWVLLLIYNVNIRNITLCGKNRGSFQKILWNVKSFEKILGKELKKINKKHKK